MTHISFSVPDISCEHCKESIEGAVGVLDGVESVEVGIESKVVAVDFDGAALSRQDIVSAIEGQGYEVTG